MTVHDLLQRKGAEVLTVSSGTPVPQALRLMDERRIGAVPILGADGHLAGLLDEGCVVRALARQGESVLRGTVDAIAQGSVPTCSPQASLQAVMSQMTHGRHRHIVVVDGEALRGIVSLGDLVNLRLRELEMESNVLRDYIVRTRPLVP